MKRLTPFLLTFVLVIPSSLEAQRPPVDGAYRAQSNDGPVVLELAEIATGVIEGRFRASGRISEVEAEMASDGSFSGFVLADEGRFYFEAAIEGEVMTLHLYPRNQRGTPDPTTAEELVFERTGDATGIGGIGVRNLGTAEEPSQPLVVATSWDYNSNQAHVWRQDLAGTEIHYVSSGGMDPDAGSIDAYYDFCYSGLFNYEIGRGGSIEMGTGEWRVATSNGVVGLELLFDHGGSDRLIMKRQGGALHANGIQVGVQSSSQC